MVSGTSQAAGMVVVLPVICMGLSMGIVDVRY